MDKKYFKIFSSFGPSGNEDEAIETVKNLLKGKIDKFEYNVLGSLIAFKKGYGKIRKK